MWKSVEQVLQSAKILRKGNFREIAIICIAAQISLAVGLLLQQIKPYSGFVVQLLSLGILRYVMNFLSGKACGFTDIFFIFTSPRRFGKGVFVSLIYSLLFVGASFLNNGLTLPIYAVGFIWLSILKYQLALEPESSIKSLLMSIGKMSGNCLRYLLLLFMMQLRILALAAILIPVAFLGGMALVIPGTVFLAFWIAPYIYMGEGVFMYQIITGKTVAPKTQDEPQDSFTKLSEHLNTHAGLRCNAALDVLAGPSPDRLIPPPEECDLPENGAMPPEEDWEALYGDVSTAEIPEDTPEDSGDTGRARLGEMVLRADTAATASSGLDAKLLLAEMQGLPRGMRADTKLQKLFQKTLNHAVEDMEAYEGAEREGLAASSTQMQGNHLRLVVRVRERALPPGCEAVAELFINESA